MIFCLFLENWIQNKFKKSSSFTMPREESCIELPPFVIFKVDQITKSNWKEILLWYLEKYQKNNWISGNWNFVNGQPNKFIFKTLEKLLSNLKLTFLMLNESLFLIFHQWLVKLQEDRNWNLQSNYVPQCLIDLRSNFKSKWVILILKL